MVITQSLSRPRSNLELVKSDFRQIWTRLDANQDQIDPHGMTLGPSTGQSMTGPEKIGQKSIDFLD